MGDDIPTQILIEIRDSIRGTNSRLDSVNQRLDQTNERVERTNERLDRVIHEQIRHATAIVELEKGQREIVQVLVRMNDELRSHNVRLDNILTGPLGSTTRENKERIDDLQHRVEVLEKRAS